jgi:hypothetical protein
MLKTLILSTSLIFVIGCGRDNIKNGTSSEQTRSGNDYSNTHAYISDSPYAQTLENCVLIEDEDRACTLSTLPLLGQESYTLTKEMILQRLLVSHQWMGDRFSQMLDRYSDKMIQQLFRATTAIVIDDDIIPAYYWAVTGAIYLDPRYLWTSQSEKETITQKEDYRSGFGTSLLFVEGTFYQYNGTSLYTQDNPTRSLRDVELSLAGLLYHELTHANDFVPPSQLAQLDSSKTLLDNIINIGGIRVSEQLYASNPAQSETLKALGQVLYQGETPSATQKQMTGSEVGQMFNDDVTDAMYAYSTRYEDTAMLMQSSMMKYFYHVDSFQVFLNADAYEQGQSVLEWGMKNPLLREPVLDRAVYVADRILPKDGGWAESLYSISDSATLLATTPTNSSAYISNSIHINPNELKFNKNQKVMNF